MESLHAARLSQIRQEVERAASNSLTGTAQPGPDCTVQVLMQWALLLQHQLQQANACREELQHPIRRLMKENQHLREQIAQERPDHPLVAGHVPADSLSGADPASDVGSCPSTPSTQAADAAETRAAQSALAEPEEQQQKPGDTTAELLSTPNLRQLFAFLDDDSTGDGCSDAAVGQPLPQKRARVQPQSRAVKPLPPTSVKFQRTGEKTFGRLPASQLSVFDSLAR